MYGELFSRKIVPIYIPMGTVHKFPHMSLSITEVVGHFKGSSEWLILQHQGCGYQLPKMRTPALSPAGLMIYGKLYGLS